MPFPGHVIRRRRDDAEGALAERDPAPQARLARDSLNSDQLASALPAGSALVSFVRVRPKPTPSGHVWPHVYRGPGTPGAYLAFVLRAGEGDPILVTLGDATRIDALVQTWADEAARGALAGGRSPGQALRAYREAGRALRVAAWEPLLTALDGVQLVVTVPDGALNLVNWATLPTGAASYQVQPSPADRLHARLAGLPPEALRLVEGALERAQARARITGGVVLVVVEIEVAGDGLHAVTVPARVERRLT